MKTLAFTGLAAWFLAVASARAADGTQMRPPEPFGHRAATTDGGGGSGSATNATPRSPVEPSVAVLYTQVTNAVATEQWAAAAATAERIIALDASFANAYRARAYALYELGRFADAETALARFRELVPRDHHSTLVLLGRIQMARERYRDAAATFEQVVLRQPRTPGIYSSLGKLYYQLGDLDRAADRLETARQRDPQRFREEATTILKSAYAQRIDELVAASRLEQAVVYLDRVLALDPPMALAFLKRGAVLSGLGTDLSRAEDDVITYITRHTGTARAYLLLGNIRQKQGRFGPAMASYEQALALDPAIPGVHAVVGALAYKLRDFQKAIANLSQALERTPEDAVTRYNLGMAYFRAERLKEARQAMEQVIAVSPASPGPYLVLSQIALYAEEIERALERLEQWAVRVRTRDEIDRLEKERVFELLYNHSRYRALIDDLKLRL